MRRFNFILLGAAATLFAVVIISEVRGSDAGQTGGIRRVHSSMRRVPAVRRGPVLGSSPHTRLTLLDIRRAGRTMSAKLSLAVDRDAGEAWDPQLEGNDGHYWTAEGLRVIDEVNGREHFPLLDADGGCYCSTNLDFMDPGDTIGVYAKFPAPPPGVDRVSLHVPGFPSFDDLPIEP